MHIALRFASLFAVLCYAEFSDMKYATPKMCSAMLLKQGRVFKCEICFFASLAMQGF